MNKKTFFKYVHRLTWLDQYQVTPFPFIICLIKKIQNSYNRINANCPLVLSLVLWELINFILATDSGICLSWPKFKNTEFGDAGSFLVDINAYWPRDLFDTHRTEFETLRVGSSLQLWYSSFSYCKLLWNQLSYQQTFHSVVKMWQINTNGHHG